MQMSHRENSNNHHLGLNPYDIFSMTSIDDHSKNMMSANLSHYRRLDFLFK